MPFFAQYNLFGANVYMCYDYVHLDNLSDISAYRNHNVSYSYVECKSRKRHICPKFVGSVYYVHYINRYVYDSMVNATLNRTIKIRKV